MAWNSWLVVVWAFCGRPIGVADADIGPVDPVPVKVEVEEEVYRFENADNGAGPMWCSGSSCLVRSGETVFASALDTIPGAKPLNNCRWRLLRRAETGWVLVAEDPVGRTREPSPLGLIPGKRLFLSANPTLMEDPSAYSGPSRPELWEFEIGQEGQRLRTMKPVWRDTGKFTEHSYRSFAVDGRGESLVWFQNVDYTHAEWAYRDAKGGGFEGRLPWPWGADYEKPGPIRICYPNVAVSGGAVYFCGVSDIIEPKAEWRRYKRELTGREWDYDFRRLFFTWTPDISKEPFRPWLEVASRESTCGWISPGDLRVVGNGAVQVIWSERALDERLRERFFPGARQRYSLEWATLQNGQITKQRTLLEGGEDWGPLRPGQARFHETPEGRVAVVCYVGGGEGGAGNDLLWLGEDGAVASRVRLPLARPFTSFFTATPRAGSAPSAWLDLLGIQEGKSRAIGYARLRIGGPPRR